MAYIERNGKLYKQVIDHHGSIRWLCFGKSPKRTIMNQALFVMSKYENRNLTEHPNYLYARNVAYKQLGKKS
jgi:hypothetical protein